MSRTSFAFGVESLEHRLLMAVIPSLPAEASAEYAAPAPHDGMPDSNHGAGLTADVEIPAASILAHTVSLSVERGALSNVLMVQLLDLQQPQVIGIVGGAAATTDGDGAVHFEIPHASQQIDLALGDQRPGEFERFLRVAISEYGQITSYTRLTTAASGVPHQELTVVVGNGGGNTIVTVDNGFVGVGLAQFTLTGASMIHHGNGGSLTPVPTEKPGQLAAASTTGAHELADHSPAVNVTMAVAAVMEFPSAASETDMVAAANDGAPKRTASVATETMAQGRGFAEAGAAGEQATEFDHETLEAVFANWAGGEEAAPLETNAMFVVEALHETSPTSYAPPQPAVLPPAELLVPHEAEQLAEEFVPELDKEVGDSSVWRAAGAFIVSAGCAIGAYILERRAGQTAPARVQPVWVRRRTTSAPATVSLAKAAM